MNEDNTTTPVNLGAPFPGTEPVEFHGPAFPAPQGWICPRCGAANAPFVAQCPCHQAPPSYPPYGPWRTDPWTPPPQPYWPSNPPPYPGWPLITCCYGGAR